MIDQLEDKAIGCLVGAAVGDAIGGATEGWDTEAIRDRHGGFVTGIVGPFLPDWRSARPLAPYYKGDGHVTDDTLMTHAMVKAYSRKRDHLDAFDIARYLVPQLIEEPTWIPELEEEALLLKRIFLAEKWLVLRLHYGNVDPREAGQGNIVNCGAAMYMAPVGIVNAGNPARAYAEAIDVAGAHQSSFGREAAGVFAAAVAAAMAPGATVSSIVADCLALAQDGTRDAIEAVCNFASSAGTWKDSLGAMRDAIRPFDTVADSYRQPGPLARRPSRVHSIEELPVALGFLVLTDGSYSDTVLAAANYGRDADSIALMGGAVAGALGGSNSIPNDWRRQVTTASNMDIEAPGSVMAQVAREVFLMDREKSLAHVETFTRLIN